VWHADQNAPAASFGKQQGAAIAVSSLLQRSPPPLPLLLPLLLLLAQVFTLNRRVQAQNRAPDDFPGFIREGFDITIVGEGYQMDPSGCVGAGCLLFMRSSVTRHSGSFMQLSSSTSTSRAQLSAYVRTALFHCSPPSSLHLASACPDAFCAGDLPTSQTQQDIAAVLPHSLLLALHTKQQKAFGTKSSFIQWPARRYMQQQQEHCSPNLEAANMAQLICAAHGPVLDTRLHKMQAEIHSQTHCPHCMLMLRRLIYKDFVLGGGNSPADGQQVVFDYTGYNESGTIVDSSYRKGRAAEVRLGINGLIPGKSMRHMSGCVADVVG
jgi:FKBP-type peptidyl-prolyl cis-trans isomerase